MKYSIYHLKFTELSFANNMSMAISCLSLRAAHVRTYTLSTIHVDTGIQWHNDTSGAKTSSQNFKLLSGMCAPHCVYACMCAQESADIII